MTVFHVNPKTGNTGICKAKDDGCPFGSSEDHFDAREEAQASYEKKQEKFEHFNWKSKLPPTKGAYSLAIYDPMSEDVPADQLWGNKVFRDFVEKMDEVENKTRLVVENGQVFEKNGMRLSGDSWKFIAGRFDPGNRLEKKHSYDRAYIGFSIMRHGARLEAGGTTPTMSLKYKAGVFPDHEELVEEAESVRSTFTKSDGAPTREGLDEHLADYVAERWYELSPQQHMLIQERLRRELGEPVNFGAEGKPAFIWTRTVEGGVR